MSLLNYFWNTKRLAINSFFLLLLDFLNNLIKLKTSRNFFIDFIFLNHFGQALPLTRGNPPQNPLQEQRDLCTKSTEKTPNSTGEDLFWSSPILAEKTPITWWSPIFFWSPLNLWRRIVGPIEACLLPRHKPLVRPQVRSCSFFEIGPQQA